MANASYFDLPALSQHLRHELKRKKPVLIYAYNGSGKTRLSTAFKDIGKEYNEDGEEIGRDTLYFNAFTEDLFTWFNDFDNDENRVLQLNDASSFFDGLRELEMENRVGPLLERYTDLQFFIQYEDREEWKAADENERKKYPKAPCVMFFRDRDDNDDPIPIKPSRGEENIFVWCFFLAIVQLAMDGAEAYDWVKHIYIDDPISSLDEHNAVMVAHHLTQMLGDASNDLGIVVSTHHVMFFNVLCNEMKKSRKYFLTRDAQERGFTAMETTSTPFLYHLATLVDLHEMVQKGTLYTHHFNMMRRVMEQTACFFGHDKWSECIKAESGDPNEIIYKRIIDLMSHGDYSLYEPREMMPENKGHFSKLLTQFTTSYPFSPELFTN